MRTRPLVKSTPVAAELVAVLTVPACGGSRHAAAFPVADFDALHPRAQDLPAIGADFARYGNAGGTAARLEALPAPRRHAGDWTRLRALLDSVATNARQQIAAAEKSDVASSETTVHTARSLATRIDQVAPKVGFTSSSQCQEVFG